MPPRVKTAIPPAPPKKKPDATPVKRTDKTTQVVEKVKEKAKKVPASTKPVKQEKKAKKVPPAAPPVKKKGGRKPWLPDLAKIENYATQGLLDKEIAALCSISHEEFCRKKNQLPQLNDALEHGRAKGIAAVSQKLLALALGGSERSIFFYLERIGKRHKTINLETPNKPIHEMTEAELNAILNGQPLPNEM